MFKSLLRRLLNFKDPLNDPDTSAKLRLELALESSGLVDWDYNYERDSAHRSLRHDQLYGYSEMLPTWNFDNFFHHVLPEYHALAKQKFANIPETGEISFEYQIRRVDGAIRWISLVGKGERNSAGKVVRVAGILKDITDEKAREDKNSLQGKNIESLFENSSEFFCVLDSDLVYEYVNPAHIRLFEGRSLKGLSVDEAQPELKGSPFLEDLRRIFETGKTITFQDTPVQIGRRLLYVDMMYTPKRDAAGDVNGIYALGADVTPKIHALKNAQKSFNEAEIARRELHELLMQAPAPMCLLSGDDYVFTMANPEYEKLVNRDVLGKTLDQVFMGQDIDLYREIIHQVYTTGKPYNIKEAPFDVTGENGESIHKFLNVGYHPYLDLDGSVKGVLVICQDVSEEVKSLQARDSFISVASHELKTPLTALKLQVQLQQKIISDYPDRLNIESLRKFLAKSDSQLDRLDRLVNDMLDGSRTSAEKLEMQFGLNDFSKLVKDTFQFYLPQFSSANIEMNLKIESEIKFIFDESRLEQVLINLVTNAIRYAPGKPLEVFLKKNGEEAVLEVTDHGPGIAEGDQEVIFQRFGRVNLRRDVTGLGLGLFISRKIVESHNGTISVKSSPGAGATFSVRLPLRMD